MPASIRDIAQRTGVSTATVSQALRGVGRLSPATRGKIHAAALELGYQSDPLLSRAFARIRSPGKRYRETLAFIVEWKTESSGQYQKDLYRGACERASGMGYAIETFIASGTPSQHRRLSKVLHARGIRGVIVIPRLGARQPRLHFDWQHFAAVEVGRTLWHPRSLHRVETEGYQNVREALHLLKKAGYRRIGMAIEPAQNRHQNGIFYAAFLLSQMRQSVRKRVPILDPDTWNEKSFRKWMEQQKPDVLILHRIKLISTWLKNMKLRVPEDISLFCVNAQEERLSGLRRDYAGLGRAAVEMVSMLLANEEIGLPTHARGMRVDEFWQAGSTLRLPIDKYISKDGSLIAR